MNNFRPARLDRIGSAVLTLGLLASSTWAVGTEWFGSAPPHAIRTAPPAPRVVMLDPVVVVAKRAASDTRIASR